MFPARCLTLILFITAAFIAQRADAEGAEGEETSRPVQTGFARLHDGTTAPFEVYGQGKRSILFGFPFYPGSEAAREYIDRLAGDYRLIFSPYPGDPNLTDHKLYTLTAAALMQDFLRIADAAGVKEFAYFGYSWGATMGLQLALRTDRVKALIVGGFPMINGPYEDIRQTLRFSIADATSDKGRATWTYSRQVLTYYESLISFDDRKIQDQLTLPRVNFVGSKDTVVFPGNVRVNFYEIFQESEKQLQQTGWSTVTLTDHDHMTAMRADAVLTAIRPWLDRNWPPALDGGNQPRGRSPDDD